VRACFHACAGGEFEKVHLTVDDEGQIEQALIKAMVWIHEAFDEAFVSGCAAAS
jgi:hypothetical protein